MADDMDKGNLTSDLSKEDLVPGQLRKGGDVAGAGHGRAREKGDVAPELLIGPADLIEVGTDRGSGPRPCHDTLQVLALFTCFISNVCY